VRVHAAKEVGAGWASLECKTAFSRKWPKIVEDTMETLFPDNGVIDAAITS